MEATTTTVDVEGVQATFVTTTFTSDGDADNDMNEDPDDETQSIDMDEPEAAPGERAADTNDIEDDTAVETTPVATDDDAGSLEFEQASSEQKDE